MKQLRNRQLESAKAIVVSVGWECCISFLRSKCELHDPWLTFLNKWVNTSDIVSEEATSEEWSWKWVHEMRLFEVNKG